MPKPSHGGPRLATDKKKAKKREEPRPVASMMPADAATEPVQPEATPNGRAAATVVQFRPKGREAPLRGNVGRSSASARALLQPVDYSYVFTDLRIIGALSGSLLVALIALFFIVAH